MGKASWRVSQKKKKSVEDPTGISVEAFYSYCILDSIPEI